MPALRCPRDATLLASTDIYGCRHYVCTGCQGYWLPGAALRRHLRTAAFDALLIRGGAAPASSLRCLNDDSPLAAVLTHGCEIDLCPRCHGLWLDHGEAEKLAATLRSSSTLLPANRPPSGDPPSSSNPTELLGDVLRIISSLFAAL